MKKLFSTLAATATGSICLAQSINLDMSPVTSSLRSAMPDIVNIACAIFLVVAIAYVSFKYYGEREQWVSGIILSVFITVVIWGAARIAINAFL